MFTFRIIGVLLIAVLLAWFAVAALVPLGDHPTPSVLGLGNAFEGNLQLPAETINSHFEAARQRMIAVNTWGTNLRLAGDLSGWLSFAATASITLIVGFFGRSPTAAGAAPNTDGLPSRSVRVIGFLAAVAAVLTAAGSLSIAKSQDYFKRADEIRDLMVHDRAQMVDAPTPEAAQAVLDHLDTISQR